MEALFNPSVLAAAFRIATPLLLAALGCLMCHKAGVENLAIEGFMLMGCFISIACITLTNGSALLGMLAAIATGILIGWAAEGHASINCRYIVVLGAGVDGTVPSLSLRERLDAAYDYLIAHPQTICVVSGGQGDGEDITEAECMYMDLIRRGIDPERIWQEDQATTTAENLRYSLALIEERTGKRPTQIGLVSSEYHLYRAGRMAADQGVSAVGIPAHTGLTILRWNYYLREIAAVWYYTILGG